MAVCIICGRKGIRRRVLSITTKICAECTNNMKENNYILTCEHNLNARNNCSSISESRTNVNNVSLAAPLFSNNEDFKNALLYSQVDFLRKELEEKSIFIRVFYAFLSRDDGNPCRVN